MSLFNHAMSRNDLVTNLVIYPSHDERVVFKKHDGSARERARLDVLRARMAAEATLSPLL